jgi:hypothetical protein
LVRGSCANAWAREYVAGYLQWKYGSSEGGGIEIVRWRQTRDFGDRACWEMVTECDDRDALRDRYSLDVLIAEGYRAQSFLEYEMGNHLVIGTWYTEPPFEPIQIAVIPLAEGQDAAKTLVAVLDHHEKAVRDAIAHGATDQTDPLRWRSTVVTHFRTELSIDLQSGFQLYDGYECYFPKWVFAGTLPLPFELRDLR